MSPIPAAVRARIIERDQGVCRRCGRAATDIQHRRGRGAGGTSLPDEHSLARCVSLCRLCHRWAETERTQAYATGWAVRRSAPDDCDQIPMQDISGRLLWLTDDGGVIYQ